MADVLVVTAVPAEQRAVLRSLDDVQTVTVGPYRAGAAKSGAGTVLVLAGGVGPARAAACAATGVALDRPGLLLVAGVGGGFAGRAAVGDIVVADLIVHADLGADSPEGFLPIDRLGFGPDRVFPAPDLVEQAADRASAVTGPIVTVSTATGTAQRAAELAERYAAAAEGMEGAGGWAAAGPYGLPFLELRAVSNLVGPRDPASWDMPGALTALGRAVAEVLAEPLS